MAPKLRQSLWRTDATKGCLPQFTVEQDRRASSTRLIAITLTCELVIKIMFWNALLRRKRARWNRALASRDYVPQEFTFSIRSRVGCMMSPVDKRSQFTDLMCHAPMLDRSSIE